MKITSSTSITSMYGTTFIWLMVLRGRICQWIGIS
jgi:hypothetical protein